jgi:hypothetical protein
MKLGKESVYLLILILGIGTLVVYNNLKVEEVSFQPVGNCQQSPCLLFDSSELPGVTAQATGSQFWGLIPGAASYQTSPWSGGGSDPEALMQGAALRCVLGETNTCSSAKSVFFNHLNGFTSNVGIGGGADAARKGGRIMMIILTYDFLRGAGELTPTEISFFDSWLNSWILVMETELNSVTGNAAMNNQDIPLTSALILAYRIKDDNNNLNNKVGKLTLGLSDFDAMPPEGMNYHPYSMEAATIAAKVVEQAGYGDILVQNVYMPVVIADLYMGSYSSDLPNCPATAPAPLSTFADNGKWFMHEVEANPCEKGIRSFSPGYLALIDLLKNTDLKAAERAASRFFGIHNSHFSINGAMNSKAAVRDFWHLPYLLPVLFWDDNFAYPGNLDLNGDRPAGFHKDQKNNAGYSSFRFDGFDLDGDGGLHMMFNKLQGNNRVGSLFMVRDGYMTHLHGSESGSTEKYAGSFPVEVSPGRGSYPGGQGGHRLRDHNIFLPDSFTGENSNFHYYAPPSYIANPNTGNHEGKFNYHLEGFFGSGSEAENKRVWQMNCAFCRANRFVGMVQDPDDVAYVFEYVETLDDTATDIIKRSHSLAQPTSVSPATGSVGYGYEVNSNMISGNNDNNRGVTRFFEPVNPIINLPSSTYSTLQKELYEIQSVITTTPGNLEADWLYITELIPDGIIRNTPNLDVLPVTAGEGYGGVIDWNSNGLNKGFKDYIVARRHDSGVLNLVSSEININTDARIVNVRKNSAGQILNYVVFDATVAIVDGVQLLGSSDRISVSVFPGVQAEAVGTPNNPSTNLPLFTVFAPAGWQTMPGPANSDVIFNGQQVVYNTPSPAPQGGEYVTTQGFVLTVTPQVSQANIQANNLNPILKVDTNQPSTCTWQIGAGQTTQFTTTSGSEHITTISGLVQGQNVINVDCATVTGVTGSAQTTYDLLPAGQNVFTIQNLIRAVTDTTLTITFDTLGTGTQATVDYGTTQSYGQTYITSTYEENHNIVLSGLQPSTTYNFMVTAVDNVGNQQQTQNLQEITQVQNFNLLFIPVIGDVVSYGKNANSGATSYGVNSLSIGLQASGWPGDSHTLVYYDISSQNPNGGIPLTANTINAQLNFDINSINTGAQQTTIEAYLISNSATCFARGNPGGGNGVAGNSNWDDVCTPTQWNSFSQGLGGDYYTTPVASLSLTPNVGQIVNLDVSSLITDVLQTGNNYGILIRAVGSDQILGISVPDLTVTGTTSSSGGNSPLVPSGLNAGLS